MPGSQGIDGIVSNLNTTEIIKAVMDFERRNIRRMESDIQEKTQKMSVFNTISAKVLSLKVKADKLTRAATFEAAKVSVSDEDYLTASVGGKISSGQYSVKVEQLASYNQIASQGFATKGTTIGTGEFTIQLGDGSAKTIEITSENNTLEGLKDAINDSGSSIQAAIINDGSSSNPYRLLLTSTKSGAENMIQVSSSLSGGEAPDFVNSSFDAVEKTRWTNGSTAEAVVGDTASYTGSENKTYTFTVAGSGTQTIGTDEIELNWSDGTNSGTLTIAAGYTPGDEIALAGAGSDGLKLSFSDGILAAGDSFQVQAFTPELQAAQDAKVSLGDSSGGGSPITVSSSTNEIKDLIPGVTLNLKKVTDATTNINIDTTIDKGKIVKAVEDFVNSYNDVMNAIDQQFKYNEESTEIGILFGDSTLRTMQTRMRTGLLTSMSDLDSDYVLLSQLGVRHDVATGKLVLRDRAALEDAIENNMDDLLKFFTNSGSSDNSAVEFVSSSSKTDMPDSGFVVKVTQAATKGYLYGDNINDPASSPLEIDSSNYQLKLRVDGIESNEIALTQKTYTSMTELAQEIQTKIDNDSKIGDLGVTVEASGNRLKISSNSYGSNSRVETLGGISASAMDLLGLSTGERYRGDDVQGTINGEEATGSGQMLRGKSNSEFAEGLSLKVTLTSSDIKNGNDSATIGLVTGWANQMEEMLDMFSAEGEGVIANRTDALQTQIDIINDRIAKEEERLKIREESLWRQYQALEESLNKWNSTGSFLSTQLTNVNKNWDMIRGSK